MARTNKNILIGLLLLFFILLFLVYQFYYQGKAGEEATLDQKLKEKRDAVALIAKTVRAKQQEIPTTQDLEEELIALPVWDNTEQIILQLREGEKAAGVSLQEMNVQLSDTNRLSQYMGGQEALFPTVKEIQINLNAEGSLAQIKAFLDRVEKSPRTMMVDTLSFGTGNGKGGAAAAPQAGGTLFASISLTAYYDPTNAAMVDPKWLQYPFP